MTRPGAPSIARAWPPPRPERSAKPSPSTNTSIRWLERGLFGCLSAAISHSAVRYLPSAVVESGQRSVIGGRRQPPMLRPSDMDSCQPSAISCRGMDVRQNAGRLGFHARLWIVATDRCEFTIFRDGAQGPRGQLSAVSHQPPATSCQLPARTVPAAPSQGQGREGSEPKGLHGQRLARSTRLVAGGCLILPIACPSRSSANRPPRRRSHRGSCAAGCGRVRCRRGGRRRGRCSLRRGRRAR